MQTRRTELSDHTFSYRESTRDAVPGKARLRCSTGEASSSTRPRLSYMMTLHHLVRYKIHPRTVPSAITHNARGRLARRPPSARWKCWAGAYGGGLRAAGTLTSSHTTSKAHEDLE